MTGCLGIRPSLVTAVTQNQEVTLPAAEFIEATRAPRIVDRWASEADPILRRAAASL